MEMEMKDGKLVLEVVDWKDIEVAELGYKARNGVEAIVDGDEKKVYIVMSYDEVEVGPFKVGIVRGAEDE